MGKKRIGQHRFNVVLLAATGSARVGAAEDPCASPANAIVAENCKQGVSSDIWDVNGAGSPGVRGFATQASVLPGETIEFKIKLQFGEALKRVDIFRLGYYGGKGARVMGRATLDHTPPHEQ